MKKITKFYIKFQIKFYNNKVYKANYLLLNY